jgi:hypothetical protein
MHGERELMSGTRAANQGKNQKQYLIVEMDINDISSYSVDMSRIPSVTVTHPAQLDTSFAAEQPRRDIARVLAALFEKWTLPTEAQLALLGMSPESRKVLAQYRRGERPLPNNRDVLDRAGYLMGIHKGLRLLFPEDESLRYSWVHRRNQILGGRTPLEVMLDDGLVGLARIARFIDFQRGQ